MNEKIKELLDFIERVREMDDSEIVTIWRMEIRRDCRNKYVRLIEDNITDNENIKRDYIEEIERQIFLLEKAGGHHGKDWF